MVGYINNTLSIARLDDQNIDNEFAADQMMTASGLNVSYCRFVLFESYLSSTDEETFLWHDSNIYVMLPNS